ncbi:MAG: MerR family transcriptional regulator [Thermomicrobiales bacterium]
MESMQSTTSASHSLTIGELASRFGLATHVLRHWESEGLLTPASRVSGQRRYRSDQIARVAMIIRGKESGLSLTQLREMMESPDRDARVEILRQHHATLEAKIVEIEAAKAMVEHALVCTAMDFTACPNFLRIVDLLEKQRDGTSPRLDHEMGCAVHGIQDARQSDVSDDTPA